MMLTESFVAATLATSTKSNISSTLKDVGIVLHGFQPQNTIRHGFKKSSTKPNCLAISTTHIFAAQADRAVVLIYNREKGNQEATIPFSERITSLEFVGESSGFLVLGTEGGRLVLWEVASGRQTISTASHVHSVSCLSVLPGNTFILSGSSDSNVHIWSLLQLVSFSQPQSLSSHDTPPNTPVRTFSNHRSDITALACGHSRPLTNFAVSASSDGTCYVWSTADCQVLRTILFDSASQCLAVDPADRALYSGHEDGTIQFFDFYNESKNTRNSHTSVASNPTQLDAKDSWSPASSEIGSAQCLTLSYDGTILLSGHSGGRVLSWDIAKHRVQKVVTDLGNSVTNIAMQRPEGLPIKRPRIEVKTVVKPKLELSSSSKHIGASGIPADYSLQVRITPPPPPQPQLGLLTPPNETDTDIDIDNSFHSLLTNPTFPQSLIDEAILDLTFPPSSSSSDQTSQQHQQTSTYDISFSDETPQTPSSLSKIATLQSRITVLEENLSIYVSAAERSRARRIARMERRDEFGRKKREAYLEAVKKGGDADGDRDLVMKEWESRERSVDRESDEVELGEEVYADV